MSVDDGWPCCYIIFEASEEKYESSAGVHNNIRSLDSFCDGFMPNGLFARLIAKLVDWSQNMGGGGKNCKHRFFAKHAEVFFYGDVHMRCHLDVAPISGIDKQMSADCIRVKFDKLNDAGPIIDRIHALLQDIRKDCIKRLQFHIAVETPEANAVAECGATYVLGLDALKSLASNQRFCVEGVPVYLEKSKLKLNLDRKHADEAIEEEKKQEKEEKEDGGEE